MKNQNLLIFLAALCVVALSWAILPKNIRNNYVAAQSQNEEFNEESNDYFADGLDEDDFVKEDLSMNLSSRPKTEGSWFRLKTIPTEPNTYPAGPEYYKAGGSYKGADGQDRRLLQEGFVRKTLDQPAPAWAYMLSIRQNESPKIQFRWVKLKPGQSYWFKDGKIGYHGDCNNPIAKIIIWRIKEKTGDDTTETVQAPTPTPRPTVKPTAKPTVEPTIEPTPTPKRELTPCDEGKKGWKIAERGSDIDKCVKVTNYGKWIWIAIIAGTILLIWVGIDGKKRARKVQTIDDLPDNGGI